MTNMMWSTLQSLVLLTAWAAAEPARPTTDSIAYAISSSHRTVGRGIDNRRVFPGPGRTALALQRQVVEAGAATLGEKVGVDTGRRIVDMAFGVAYAGVLLVLAFAILLQTMSASQWMPESVQNALLLLSEARTDNPLLTNTLCAFCMYSASDVLTQSLAQQRAGARAARISRSRMLRSGATSSLLSGFLAVFYFGWLERALPAGEGGPFSLTAVVFPILAKIAIDVGLYGTQFPVLALATLLPDNGQPPTARRLLPITRPSPTAHSPSL
jgi:hypothetical protein